MSMSHRIKIPAPKTNPSLFYLCRIGGCHETFDQLHATMRHCDEAHAEVIARAVKVLGDEVLYMEKGSYLLWSVLSLN